MASVSGEPGATLKRPKSQRPEETEPWMQADEEKTKPLRYCLGVCLLRHQRGNIQPGKITAGWKTQGRSFNGRELGKLVVRKKTPILTS